MPANFTRPLSRILMTGFILLLSLASLAAEKGEPKQGPKNKLAGETSPYLLMHAHNPVDWHPWGQEAFDKAKKEKKLVFLSIGYSSCYWCHVMERESFSNPEVAKLLNQWFVCIKVDREERPDIDAVYMAAVHAMRRQGGWPLSAFLTQDAKPIFAGTYWPPDDKTIEGEKYLGFKSVLKTIHDFSEKDPEQTRKLADDLAAVTTQILAGNTRGSALVDLDRDLVKGVVDSIKEEFDREHGGFGNAERKFKGTKFPVPPYLELLLQEAGRTKSAEVLEILNVTLDQMARGGIYDQLGGGFHRYSTERTWTVPHFEKMLYDNAQLAEVYAHAFRSTQNLLYRRVLQETLAFVSREMTSPDGAFFSALDAETEKEEGRYYVWTDGEIDAVLKDKEENALFRKAYGGDDQLNFESKYHIFKLPRPLGEAAKEMNLPAEKLEQRLAPAKGKLLEARGKRPRPFLDTKILTAWNGEMIAGFAVAGQVLKEGQYLEAASRAADFLLKNLRTKEGRLLRTWAAQPGKVGEAKLNGYLDDYAYLVHGLLALHDATNDKKWLDEAKTLTDTMIEFHVDKDRGGFYYTSNDHEKLFARGKDQYDSAQPSGNSVAARNLVRLWVLTKDDKYRTQAEKSFKAFAGPLKANPTGMTAMAHALATYLDTKEGEAKEDAKKPDGAKKKAVTSESKVKIAATAGKPDDDGKQTVTVTIMIEKGWHLYANPVPEDFPGIPVSVTFNAKKKPEVVKVAYPEGKKVKDPMLGEYKVYEDKVVIKADVTRAKGDDSPLELSVKVQTCDDKNCLIPGTVKVKVESGEK